VIHEKMDQGRIFFGIFSLSDERIFASQLSQVRNAVNFATSSFYFIKCSYPLPTAKSFFFFEADI
jgi:hypothetical protein